MIVEENVIIQTPYTSVRTGATITYILETIKKSPVYFKLALTNPKLVKPLNENKLTQILVEQINALLIKTGASILAQTQYSDVFLGSKGIPDFYFQKVEKGQTNAPLFIVEAKILPAPPPKEREKEYVIGNNKNGGIERFKIEKHGKGLSECGMIGFIGKENCIFWKTIINNWIEDLSKSDSTWNKNESLKELENQTEFMYLNSVAHRTTSSDILLHHFWVK